MREKSVNAAFNRLQVIFSPKKVVRDVSLARFTTLQVGGAAEIFVTVDTLSELRQIVKAARDFDLPLLTLGRGSNILFPDDGVRGIVIQLGKEFQKIILVGNEIHAGAAVNLSALVQVALKNGLKGLSFAIGIPGTLGGAIIMNAGSYGGEMSQIVRQVTIYTPDCKLKALEASELDFGYRCVNLEKGSIVLEACLGLSFGDSEEIKAEMERNFRERKVSQPLGLPSAGSIFKNPPGGSAGKLIEEAGCKGWQIGGALVSPKHANFFVNVGGAKAQDFLLLIKKVQKAVQEKHDLLLEPEIKLLGFEDSRGQGFKGKP